MAEDSEEDLGSKWVVVPMIVVVMICPVEVVHFVLMKLHLLVRCETS
jgi:hypothetical protein